MDILKCPNLVFSIVFQRNQYINHQAGREFSLIANFYGGILMGGYFLWILQNAPQNMQVTSISTIRIFWTLDLS